LRKRNACVGHLASTTLRRDLGISRRVLTQRLGWLVTHGMLDRRSYSQRPPRSEYVLSDKGRAFCDILILMNAWGDRGATGPEGPPVLHRHRGCGNVTHVHLCCDQCGQPLTATDIDVETGPGGVEPVNQLGSQAGG
jgi:DNA-binding HxlR family transcriptional regulator